MRAEHLHPCGDNHSSPQGVSAVALAHLTVIPMQNWHAMKPDQSSSVGQLPNLRNVEEATLYPGLGMLDYSNIFP